MAYFKDVFDLLLLKEEVYRRIGNDRKAFRRFTMAFLLSYYLGLFLGGFFFFAAIRIVYPQLLDLVLDNSIIILLLYVVAPFILYGVTFLFTLIPYLIGLAVGGKPRKYGDFLKVWLYPSTFFIPLMLIPGLSNIISILYTIWSYFTLYKSYQIIYKLSSRMAGTAVMINVVITLFFILIAIIFFSFYVTQNPQAFIK